MNNNRHEWYGLYTTETIAFTGTQERNETTSLFRYNKKSNGYKVPNFSSNAVRNRLRVACFTDLISRVGVTLDELPVFNNLVMFSGGPRLENSDVTIRLEFLRELFKWIPGMYLFGGTTAFNMIGSVLTVSSLDAMLPQYIRDFKIPGEVLKIFGLDVDSLPEVVTEFQFNTKKDIRELPDTIETLSKEELQNKLSLSEITDAEYAEFQVSYDDPEKLFRITRNEEKDKTVANMFDTQVLMAGTKMCHYLALGRENILKNHDILTSCLAATLKQFQKEPFLGARKSNGYGMVSFEYMPQLDDDTLYASFVEENKQRIYDILMDDKLFVDHKCIVKYKKFD